MHRLLITIATALTATLALIATLVAAPSGPAAAAEEELPTISVSDREVRLGDNVVVAGRAPSLREVHLELRTGDNRWQSIGTTLSSIDGYYSFRAPSWYGVHRLRVNVLPTLVLNGAVSESFTVTVTMPYRPKGRKSDWVWISHPGARWNPCQPITYRINTQGGYRGATADIKRSFRKIGGVAGLRFRYLGTTSAVVDRDRHDAHPAGTDVVVDWQSPRQEPALSGGIAGWGGHWVQAGRRFNGFMLLDSTERLPRKTWRQLMAHEIGHVLGLGHAHSRRQLMYGVASSLNLRLGAGDLAALGRVGASSGCLTTRADRADTGTLPSLADAA